VVGRRQRRERLEAAHPLEHPAREQRVLLDAGELGRRKRGGLVEDPARDRELADVVQQGHAAQVAELVGVEPQRRPHVGGDQARAVGVEVGPGRLGVHDRREGGGDPEQVLVVDLDQLVLGLPLCEVGVGERGPERGVAAEGGQRLHQVRVEPAAGAPLRDRVGVVDAAGGVEDLDGLRETQDAAEQRDLLAEQPARLAVAVPVLVERADRLGRAVGEPDHAGDLGPSVAARLHQRTRDLALVLDREEPIELDPGRLLGRDLADRPEEGGQLPGPVGALGGALELVVVGAEDGRHPRRVRRAAGVLEQQRVEQVRPRLGVEPKLAREPHPDQARPLRVTRRLTLGQIERIRQRPDHLREQDRARHGGCECMWRQHPLAALTASNQRVRPSHYPR
jgi:hypothetical protein